MASCNNYFLVDTNTFFNTKTEQNTKTVTKVTGPTKSNTIIL